MSVCALDDDVRGSIALNDRTSPKGGNPNVNIINEFGLYSSPVLSNKPVVYKSGAG